MVDFEKLKAPGTPPPPPPPKKKRAALQPPPHPKRQEVVPSAESQTFPEGLTEKERALFESVAEYAQITEGEAVLRPELLAALRSFRKKELFAVQVYPLDNRGSDGHVDLATHDPNTLRGEGMRNIWLQDTEFISRHSVPEALLYQPLTARKAVIEKREVKPTGLFKAFKQPRVENLKSFTSPQPVRFQDVVPDCKPEHANEQAVRVQYHVSDHGDDYGSRYPVTTRAKIPWLQEVPEQIYVREKRTMWKPAEKSVQSRINDLLRMREGPIKKYDSSGGRPGNQINIAVYLPESLAKELFHILQENPKQVRPFFLAGALDRMPHHLPPPYEMFDKENGNKRQVIFRDFTQPKEPKETVL